MEKGNRYLQIGLVITGVVTVLAVLGLFWTPYDPSAMNSAEMYAAPSLRHLFGLILHWFTPGEFVAPGVDFWGSVAYLIFPATAIALPRIAMTVKMLRSGILEELGRDYVRTAHSRGNDRRAILYRHVLRNAVVPTVAFLAMTIADIVAGSVVIEQVFAIPGMGRLLFSSISNRDYPVVQAVIVLMAFWMVLVNFVADLINQRMDPRLRLQ